MTRFRSDKPNVANLPRSEGFRPYRELFDAEKTCLVTDLDGCLVNTLEMIQIYIWDRYQRWVPGEDIKWFNVGEAIYEHLGDLYDSTDELNKSLWDGLWNVGLWYQNARPIYAYWQALLSWQQRASIPIHFLTARPDCLHATTMGWLRRWGFSPSSGCVVLEGGSIEKIKHLQQWAETYDNLVFVDDRISTILGAARAKIPGLKLVLFAQPWNLASSRDWCQTPLILEGKPCYEHPEWDLFLHHGFDVGFRRLTEAQIAQGIIEGLE